MKLAGYIKTIKARKDGRLRLVFPRVLAKVMIEEGDYIDIFPSYPRIIIGIRKKGRDLRPRSIPIKSIRVTKAMEDYWLRIDIPKIVSVGFKVQEGDEWNVFASEMWNIQMIPKIYGDGDELPTAISEVSS